MTFKKYQRRFIHNILFLIILLPISFGTVFLLFFAENVLFRNMQVDFFVIPWFIWIYFLLKSIVGLGYGIFYYPIKKIRPDEENLMGLRNDGKATFMGRVFKHGLLAGITTGIGLSGLFGLWLFILSSVVKK